MRHVVQRLGFNVGRGWLMLAFVVSALIGTAFWIGPFRPLPPELKLLALSGNGQFREAIDFPRAWADTTPPQPDVRARFPLVLAVYNAGARAASPIRLALSVPARYRLANSEGETYPGRVQSGNPLVRYVFAVSPGRIAPRTVPRVLSTLDTLWLEPAVPSYYCTALSDSVPEFVPAPPQDPNALARVRIFYSFDARVRDRQTGLLNIQVDPELLARAAAPTPPIYPARIIEPQAPQPQLGVLRRIGARTTYCGDPGTALELHDVLWETATGGRFFVVYHGGAPRKYLFDLDRDSVIELEMWDPDSDGRFEGIRSARMLIPEFLFPLRQRVRLATTGIDSLAADSLTLATAGDSTRVPGDSVGLESMEYPRDLFYNTDAGPMRFWRALQRARGVEVAEPARRPERTAPRLLGKPVPWPPDTGRHDPPDDTLRLR
ncbi:MAG TPA: hypothetical protein VK864_17010 [Longimicrobiales bacterium]|nr:hypothetical protein [Longimicrobiales bacterium]